MVKGKLNLNNEPNNRKTGRRARHLEFCAYGSRRSGQRDGAERASVREPDAAFLPTE